MDRLASLIVWSTISVWLLVTIVLAVKAVTREDRTS
jgi:hypothetical protein